ncbi:hypothetical protein Acr_14g0001790 [Actinidia rufa]|uniref:Uncharacterized protein n=1 Tax=Actinidia rufa TaxID=165716 RepID=A0A7J0FPQ8_9ERIC|nr:hypothetical protein Acr_14g0001790 [Actinidia rufa]
MHLRSRNLPRPSASSPLDNRAPPMANASQVPDLEGLHHEIHGMAEQMRVMNENNARLIQLLAAANPQPPAAPSIPDIERSRHSNRSGDRSHNVSTERARDRHQAPSPSLRERSSSSESSQTRSRIRRGRSPHRGGNTRARDKSTSQKIRDLDARLDAINTGTNAPITVDALVRQTDPPFTERVLRTRISSKFKLPTQLGIYEGKTDPMDHLDSYKSLMSLQGCSDEVMCEAFSATLKGPARSWFRKLSPGTVDSFGELSRLFVANFMSCRNRQKNASHLFTVHQKETESLKDFVKRFNQAVLDVEDPSDKSKADKYIAAEELAEAKRRRRGKEDHKRKEPDTRRVDYREEMRYKKPNRDSKRSNNRRPRTPPRRPEFNLPSLNTPVAQVLSEIKHEKFIKWPGKIKTDPQRRNRNKYCEFHRDHGHNTEDCFQLREQIADLIKRGYLRKYITDRPPPSSPERKYGDNRPTAGNIQTIHGGFGSGGCSTSSRKKHARSAFRSIEEEVYNLSSPCASDQPPITFSSDDLRGLHLPHDDALVVSAVIANFNVQRILIDSGSSADILFISAFEKMKIGLDKLHPFHTPLIGFGGNTTHPLGWINLPITLGTEPQQTTVWQDFIVVDCPSPYNSILGRPTLGRIKAITSTYHLKMKFPTLTGIGEVKGDQKTAGDDVETLRDEMEQLILEDPRETENTKPLEEVTPISIHPNYPERQVMIGTELIDELRIALTDFLKRNSDVFAWSQGDVPGIDPEVAMHKLFTKPDCSPVRQKRRKFAPERLKVIEEEISKLIKAKVVREAHYPDWLANVVVAPKKGEKWRVCVDFTDLNKACPKDSFPLPKIDLIVDATSKHELLSFMDAFSGYHQIKMYPPDVEKTSFITERGLYCYKVMPFGLKNAGATYQRLVNKMFNAQIGKTMEVYIDDMLVKSLHAQNHIAHLEEAFDILRQHRMMLNPSKCIFGVSFGKFLGFLVTKRGIEVNPDQIQALIAMRSPRNIREVQQLTGRVAALNRFVSKSADKCLPFFKILRKSQTFQWSEESENAFQQLKEYLGSPPLLSVPTANEDLYVYLSASPTAISAVLVREEDRIQKPIYYVSKTLIGAEARYPRIEKIAYALMIAARKLRHYFQAHSIIVLTDQPLKQILQRPDTSGRLLKWSIELSEFHIEYKPRTAIKAQALSDFIVESTHEDTPQPEATPLEAGISKEPTSERNLAHWILYVDGSSNQHGCGAGLVLRAPSGEQMEYAIRMGFQATNNEAEYEALLAGLRLATELGAQSLEVFSDSQLVVNQVQGDYLAKDSRMIAYLGEKKLNEYVLREIHEGVCGNHSGARSLAKKAVRQGYFWPTMERDAATFGVPKVIISDNARQFDNDRFRLFCSDLAISHHFSSPGHPQANGQVEVTNRTILRNLKASRIPTGETPYSLVFGTESVIPVEIGMPSFRTLNFNEKGNEGELRINLDLLDEKRESSELRQAAYKGRIAKYYNERVKHRSFLPGDLVLRRVTLSTRDPRAGKLGPTWEGPYKVIKVSKPGTCWLEDLNGKALPHPWNAEHLKKYYQ